MGSKGGEAQRLFFSAWRSGLFFSALAHSLIVLGVAFRMVSVQQGAQTTTIVVMVVLSVPVLQTDFAQHALDFLAQGFGHKRSVALAPSDTAYIGGIDIELHGDPLVDTAKNGERFKRVRGNIRFVTVHDFLTRKSDPATTVTTLTGMVYRIV